MRKVKVIEHGYFFNNGYLKTKCNCGCVYLTSKKKVMKQVDSYVDFGSYFVTYCPECGDRNRQYLIDLKKETEAGNDRK